MPIATKLTISHQHYVQISFTELQHNLTINVENTDINLFMLRSKVWLSLRRFHQTVIHCIVTDITYADFYPNRRRK
jgi:hypothetical protein